MYQATGGVTQRITSLASAATAIATDPHLPEALCLVNRLVPESDTETNLSATAINAANDPHLSEVVCHVLRLQGLEEGKVLKACRQIPKNYLPGKGIGLRYAIGPLRYLVAARERPFVAAAVGATIIGSLVAVGYVLGKVK